jgi:ribosomal protein L11 methyltransferase
MEQLMEKQWLEVSCTVPAPLVDSLAEFLIEQTESGVSIENLSVDTFSVETIEDPPVKTIKAYFSADAPPESIRSSITAFVSTRFPDEGTVPISISLIGEEDWANNWKQYFKPARIGSGLVIKPTWESYDALPSDIIIEVDPGQAFGTGTHATTRLCLEALEKIYRKLPPFSDTSLAPETVLDVGTGSGVLSIAAAKLGATRIYAIDIDPEAVAVARENLSLNGISGDVTVATTMLADVSGSYDIVVANIIAEELVKLSPELVDRLAPRGILVLSGILAEREPFVIEGFAKFPLALVDTSRREEWSCLIYASEKG